MMRRARRVGAQREAQGAKRGRGRTARGAGASGRSCPKKDEHPKDIFIEKYKLFYTGISNVHVLTRTCHYI
jgi:hypothetical protein